MAVPAELQEEVLKEATSATPNYDIDYNDERFAKVESEKEQTKTEYGHTYDQMIEGADTLYDGQIQATKDWEAKQSQIQQENTDFAIEKIEQQKDQAHKDYIKEQSGAYVDWQKQSNQYGVEAEKMASAGLDRTGFSESSQVSMYNTYQNRIAVARESYNRAVLNYDNAIKDAQLQNNAALAQIAHDSLMQQTELIIQGTMYKNQLINDKADKILEIDNIYYNRWQDVLNQMNTENAMKEDIRQYEDNKAWQTEQNALDRQQQKELQELQQKFDADQAELNRKHDKEMADLDQKYKLEYLNASTEKEKELIEIEHQKDIEKLNKQHQNDMAKLNQQLANDKSLIAYQNSFKKQAITGSGGSGSGSGSGSGAKSAGKTAITQNTKTGTKTYDNVDMQSVLDLGYGPISGTTLANLVNNGQAYIEEKNGKAVVKKTAQPGYASLPSSLLNTKVSPKSISYDTTKKTNATTKNNPTKTQWWVGQPGKMV
jgi:hypothetical protein